MATILLARGKYDEAEKLARQAWTAVPKEDSRGKGATGNALDTLGRISLALGRNQEAVDYLSRAALILRSTSRDAPLLAEIQNSLGQARARCGDRPAAIELLNSSITALENIYGQEHPEVASGLSNLGTVYRDLKRYKKAKALYVRALEIDRHVLGPTAPKTAVDLNNLGALAFLRHHNREAEAFLSEALKINEQSLGENHADTGLLAGNLARLYSRQRRYAEAEPLLRRAVAIRELNFGPDDPVLGVLLADYTLALRSTGNFSEAEQVQVRSTRVQVRNALRADAAQH